MTIKELKEHCVRQITEFERIKEIMPITPNDYKRYEEHKIVLQLIETLEQEPCEDCISRQALKRKLQEHHDFFIHAYNGFSNMPQNDKSRVDEINNCIAMVVNEPSVTPKEKTGAWVPTDEEPHEVYECNACGWLLYDKDRTDFKYCPNCGAKMQEVENDT